MAARDLQADASREAQERVALSTRAKTSHPPLLGLMHEARSTQGDGSASSDDDWTPKPQARALPPVEEDGFLTPTPSCLPLPYAADEDATTPTQATVSLPIDDAGETSGLSAPSSPSSNAGGDVWLLQPTDLHAALLASPDVLAPLPNTPPLVPGHFTCIEDIDDMRLPPPALLFPHESILGGDERAARALIMYVPMPDIAIPIPKASASVAGERGEASSFANQAQYEGGMDEHAANIQDIA